jgi:hypothetical protein
MPPDEQNPGMTPNRGARNDRSAARWPEAYGSPGIPGTGSDKNDPTVRIVSDQGNADHRFDIDLHPVDYRT